MALQLQVTGDAGMDITYWKINSLSNSFDGELIDLRFDIQGYKDAEWRAKGASAKSLTFHVLEQGPADMPEQLYVEGDVIPEGKSIGDVKTAAQPRATRPLDRSATILNNTSGDLRPALYSWLKSHDATSIGGVADNYGRMSQILDWSSAVDA